MAEVDAALRAAFERRFGATTDLTDAGLHLSEAR
jgi:hypothetical protein